VAIGKRGVASRAIPRGQRATRPKQVSAFATQFQ
jgi:hypothetical protein